MEIQRLSLTVKTKSLYECVRVCDYMRVYNCNKCIVKFELLLYISFRYILTGCCHKGEHEHHSPVSGNIIKTVEDFPSHNAPKFIFYYLHMAFSFLLHWWLHMLRLCKKLNF